MATLTSACHRIFRGWQPFLPDYQFLLLQDPLQILDALQKKKRKTRFTRAWYLAPFCWTWTNSCWEPLVLPSIYNTATTEGSAWGFHISPWNLIQMLFGPKPSESFWVGKHGERMGYCRYVFETPNNGWLRTGFSWVMIITNRWSVG